VRTDGAGRSRAIALAPGRAPAKTGAMRRVARWCAIVAFAGAPAHAADLLDEIAAGLDPAPVIVAQFTQTRRIAALRKPVVSQGRVVFARGRGVIWQIERPYRYAYVLSPRQITEVKASGERVARESGEVPGMAQASRVFEALLRADLDFLRQQFRVEAKGSADAWTAELAPRDAGVAGAVGRLAMKGARHVSEIEFVESNGDATRISLRHEFSGERLGAADAALLP